jgi:HSP20 family protein
MSSVSLWVRRDPFAEFDSLVRRAFAGPAPSWPSRPSSFVPAAEVAKDGDDAIVTVELPGVDVTKDVTVEVDGDQLVVHGERRDQRNEQRDGYRLREVRYGSFRRAFTLPTHVTADAVSASYDAGVLSVRVAGAYAGNGGTRQIPVTTGDRPAVEGDEATSPVAESGEAA